MFGLFGKKKKKQKASAKPSREQIIAQAQANARKAREEIGDETIQKIAKALSKKENSEFEQARRKIKSLDDERVADNIRYMIDEER